MKEVLSAETKRKLAELDALEAGGVDNWDWCSDSLAPLDGVEFTDDPEPETLWLPIDTAPVLGAMLVSVPPDHEVFEAFRDASGRWQASDPRGGGYYYLHTEPSHWMPLPPPPEETTK